MSAFTPSQQSSDTNQMASNRLARLQHESELQIKIRGLRDFLAWRMESIGPECTKLKHKYEACFNKWYSEKFLKGDTHDECEPLFREYRACLDVFNL